MKGRRLIFLVVGAILTCAVLLGTGHSESGRLYEANSQYTKLDASGKYLPADAEKWAMIKDTESGLVWEVKTTDGTLHDRNKSFKWEDIDSEFISKLNINKYGGFSDWRLPDLQEIYTIHNEKSETKYNPAFFPNTARAQYWTHTACCDGNPIACKINFGNQKQRSRAYHVRAVRGSWFSGVARNESNNSDGDNS